MKIKFHYILLLALSTAIMSCELDNYEPPTSSLSGQLVYQGTPLNLEYNRVSYELYQDGFGKTGPMSSTFTSDGAFSHLLFDGTYKMVVPDGQGPFIWENVGNTESDTLIINVNGSTEMDIEVVPYWMIRNTELTGNSDQVTGSFDLEQIVTDADARAIESVTLYVSKTLFANSQTNVATNMIEGGAITDVNDLSLSVTLPELVPAQNYVFASIGVKLAGTDDLLFSPTQKIEF